MLTIDPNTGLSGAQYDNPNRISGYGHLVLLLYFRSAWISNHMPSEVSDEITYPFPNFNGTTVEVWE